MEVAVEWRWSVVAEAVTVAVDSGRGRDSAHPFVDAVSKAISSQ